MTVPTIGAYFLETFVYSVDSHDFVIDFRCLSLHSVLFLFNSGAHKPSQPPQCRSKQYFQSQHAQNTGISDNHVSFISMKKFCGDLITHISQHQVKLRGEKKFARQMLCIMPQKGTK